MQDLGTIPLNSVAESVVDLENLVELEDNLK